MPEHKPAGAAASTPNGSSALHTAENPTHPTVSRTRARAGERLAAHNSGIR